MVAAGLCFLKVSFLAMKNMLTNFVKSLRVCLYYGKPNMEICFHSNSKHFYEKKNTSKTAQTFNCFKVLNLISKSKCNNLTFQPLRAVLYIIKCEKKTFSENTIFCKQCLI